MYHHLSPHLQAFNRNTQRPAPSWPNSSTGRTLHQHRIIGQGSNPCPGQNFSGLSCSCMSSTKNYKDQTHSLCALFPLKYSTPPLLSKICTLLLCFLAGAKEGVKNLPRKITFLGRGQAVDWKQAYKELLMYYRELAEAKLAEQEKNG